MTTETVTSFDQLALSDAVRKVLKDVGYESPSPIQAQTIPLLLEGRDVLGQAQTGTGKTAAFALPILSNLNLAQKAPQALVLAPTRELAIQVAEAFQSYAAHMRGFHVLPVYGGQDYRGQLRGLERGAHVVVGTPGRVMDHIRRGTLKLNELTNLVLDEADEMLRMGFIDDVEWILEQIPAKRQIALFSATMPPQVRRIANKHLTDPVEVSIKVKTTTASTIRQRYWPVSGVHKLDALTRILEAENFDGMIVFVRTRTATVELADKLEARGYAATALNGDVPQNLRERSIANLKAGKLDILVATDVAARGLDVERISHVVNYDIPNDTEAYVHRIGRTGRAGRQGDAILFVAPRERRMLSAIERATRQRIEIMELPSTELINDKRIAKFKQRITDTLAAGNLGLFPQLIEQYQQEHNVTAVDIAAALAHLVQGDAPFLLQAKGKGRHQNETSQHASQAQRRPDDRERSARPPREDVRERPARPAREKPEFERKAPEPRAESRPEPRPQPARSETRPEARSDARPERSEPRPARAKPLSEGMVRYRIEVGQAHEVQPNNIVGAIANEAGLESQHIGRIDIRADYTVVELPEGMPKDIFNDLKRVWVAGRQLQISHCDADGQPEAPRAEVSGDTAKRKKPKAGGKPKSKSKPKPRKSNSE